MSLGQRRVVVVGAAVAVLVGGWLVARSSSKKETPIATDGAKSTDDASPPAGPDPRTAAWSGPFAAAAMGNGDVVVATLDGTTLRAQRIDRSDKIVADQVLLRDVAVSPDADLKVFAAPEGVFVLWRGLHEGKLDRLLLALEPDLTARGKPTASSSVACATRSALWTLGEERAVSHPFAKGEGPRVALPADRDPSLFCAAGAAYAVLDADERTQLMPLDGARDKPVATTAIKESDFGEDEQRELSEYAAGDDVGFVRLATSGALALREVSGAKAGPLHRLKTAIGRDDDVVAVDASPRAVVVVYTVDVAEDGGDRACPRVMAVRIDRQSFEESTVELSPGRCGFEVGPFFTSAVGDAVSVAWPERTGGLGQPRAPIVALATALVAPAEAPKVGRIEQAADALVDASCDATGCYAVARVRAEASSAAKVLRYNAPR